MHIQSFPKSSAQARIPISMPATGRRETPQEPVNFCEHTESGPCYEAIAGSAIAGCTAFGAAAGLTGGLLARIAAWGSIPGLVGGAAFFGAVLADKLVPGDSRYPLLGGAALGGLAGAGLFVKQALEVGGAGSLALAARLGLSASLTGLALGATILLWNIEA